MKKTDGSWMASSPEIISTLTGSSTTGWTYKFHTTTENYNAQGRLTSIVLAGGETYTLTYEQLSSGRLTQITDPKGRQLNFAYGANGRVATMTNPAGGVFTYAYDTMGRLISVTYPDNRVRQYKYEHAKFKFALTSIINEAGQTHVTFTYDQATGRATGNWFGDASQTGANAVGKVALQYTANGSVATEPGATNPSIPKVTREFVTVQGLVLPKKMRYEEYDTCGTACTPLEETFTYDTEGRVTSKVDMRGTTTNYTYTTDGRGLLATTVEAAGTALARSVTTTWHPTLRLPTQIIEPTRTTNYTYDSVGRKLSESIVAGGETRTTTYTRNALGQITSVDGPRTDVTDVTTYTYHADGNLATVTTPAGLTTTYNSYNVHGNATAITAPDGTVSYFSYDARGRITAKNIGGLATYYGYTQNGQLYCESDPYGQNTFYYYDSAQRLIGKDLTNGDKIRYTLDNAGRTIVTQTFDAQNVLSTSSSTVYDRLGRVKQRIDANGKITSYVYDANGNVTSTTDPNGLTTATAYDALNRPILVTDPLQKTVAYTYTADNKVASVRDPNNNFTTYTYNGFGDNTGISSPDTGNTTVTFNAAGLPVLKTDSRGKTTTHVYDASGRMTWMIRSDGANTFHSYQVSGNGVGQLAYVSDPSGTTQYYYDAYGRVTQKTFYIGNAVRPLQYTRDDKGRITAMTYPSGIVVGLTYTNNRVTAITANGTTLISGVEYFPFGGPESWIMPLGGANKEYTRYIDQNSRIRAYRTLTGLKHVGYDNGGRVQSILTEIPGVNGAQSAYPKLDWYVYDNAGRLATGGFYSWANGVYPAGTWQADSYQSFGYDNNGNRTAQDRSGVYTTYNYAPTSNRLTSVTGALSQTNTYDTAGNLTSDGAKTYAYDARGRMTQSVANGLTTSYLINYQNQRVKKSNAQETRLYVYDDAGHMIGEYDQAGNFINEIFWLGDIPVALYGNMPCGTGVAGCRENAFGFIWTDHLNTPREITRLNASNQHTSIWKWDSLPFGETAPNENPSNLGTMTFNHRFPGQYYDKETGLHQNWHRDYDPRLGRYLTSDPLGLFGGTNTYSYAGAMPLQLVDRKGLFATCAIDGNNINISIPITFSGPASSPALIAQFTQAVQTAWTGRTNDGRQVNVRVTTGTENTVRFEEGDGRANVRGGNAATCLARDEAWVFAHEAGHLLGLADRYRDTTGPNGAVISVPLDGFAGTMMGSANGTVTSGERSAVVNTWCGVTGGGG